MRLFLVLRNIRLGDSVCIRSCRGATGKLLGSLSTWPNQEDHSFNPNQAAYNPAELEHVFFALVLTVDDFHVGTFHMDTPTNIASTICCKGNGLHEAPFGGTRLITIHLKFSAAWHVWIFSCSQNCDAGSTGMMGSQK